MSILATSILPQSDVAAATLEATPRDSNSVFGLWRTQAGGGVVELYPCNERVCGRLVWIDAPSEANSRTLIDRNNHDLTKRRQPLCELAVLGNFKQKEDEWTHGWIYSPDSGSTYEGTLRLRDAGHLTIQGVMRAPLTDARIKWTREWTRAESTLSGCYPMRQ